MDEIALERAAVGIAEEREWCPLARQRSATSWGTIVFQTGPPNTSSPKESV